MSFWVKSLRVKSIWVKSMCNKSFWVKSLWVKSILVKSMCKKRFWVKSLCVMYLYICVHTLDPENSVSGPWPFLLQVSPDLCNFSWPFDLAVCCIVVQWPLIARLFYILKSLCHTGICPLS